MHMHSKPEEKIGIKIQGSPQVAKAPSDGYLCKIHYNEQSRSGEALLNCVSASR